MPIAGIRQCGARCRTKNGDPCLQPAMRDSNRCRMHFGHARKLRTHGRLTIQAEEERRQQRLEAAIEVIRRIGHRRGWN